MFKNSHNLPEPVIAAILNDPYNAGDSDITVTGLISPPQMVELKRRHGKEIEEEIGDRLWATYGHLMHGLLERMVKSNPEFSKRYISEARIFTEINGWKVSGQFDLFDTQKGILYDYKFVGGYAVKMAMNEGKIEWEQQLNLLRYLLQKEMKFEVKKVAIVGMVRDFSERLEKEGIKPVGVIHFPVWDDEEIEKFIVDRVKLHQKARDLNDSELPKCTDEERWLRNGKYARCSRYCQAAPFCETWKNHERS